MTDQAPPLRIEVTRRSPDTSQVAVAGEIDMATAHELREALLQVLREPTLTVINIDLADVKFIDCTGISALVDVRNSLSNTDAR